jgi:hypothetical protein
MPTKQCLRLDNEERLFPGPRHPSQEHQEQPIRLSVHRAFDLSTQDEELVAQQRVFREQFGFASGQIGERTEYKGGRRWLHPPQNTFLKRMEAKRDALLDRGKHTQHK